MIVGIVAAAGKLGSRIVTECLDRGHEVTAFINHSTCKDERARSIRKSLFDLRPEDVKGFDVLFSAYGSGFEADPVINRQALNHLADLVQGTETRLISIAGSGCLFSDESRKIRVYELPEHPVFLKGISRNTALGVEDVMGREDVRCTFVSPGLIFDAEGPRSGEYISDTGMTVQKDPDGSSYTSYSDMAAAMVEFAEHGSFDNKFVSVLSLRGNTKPSKAPIRSD